MEWTKETEKFKRRGRDIETQKKCREEEKRIEREKEYKRKKQSEKDSEKESGKESTGQNKTGQD